MKNLFLFFAIFISSNLFSQITLTSSNNPVPGNTMLNVECDTVGIVQGNAGTNQTWNFTGIVRQDSSILNWVASSSTPYGSQFPTSNVAATIDSSNYQFFTSSSSNLLTNGIGGPSLIVSNTDPEIIMQYPFTYNNSFSDNFSATFMSTGFTIYRTGTSNVTCDAWGTINLPAGSFSNAIRVKYDNVTTDSSNPGVPLVFRTASTSYVWFVANRKFPIFQISYFTISLNGTPQSSSKSVSYNPNNPTIGITQLNTNVPDNIKLSQNYPNPFNPTTKIRFDITSNRSVSMSNVMLVVYNQLGKEIAFLVNESLSPGSYEVDWDASDAAGGVYYYKLTAGDFTQTKKMTLIK